MEAFGSVNRTNSVRSDSLELACAQGFQDTRVVRCPAGNPARWAARRHGQTRAASGGDLHRLALEWLAAIDTDRAALSRATVNQFWLHACVPTVHFRHERRAGRLSSLPSLDAGNETRPGASFVQNVRLGSFGSRERRQHEATRIA
jgi:hypothetical protein